MSKLSRSNHLLRRNGVWYYRRRLTGSAIQCFGRIELKFLLRTREISIARKKANIEDVKFDATLQKHLLKSDVDVDVDVEENLVGKSSHDAEHQGISLEGLEDYLEQFFSLKREKAYNDLLSDPFENNEGVSEATQETEWELQQLQNRDAPYCDQWVSFSCDEIMKFIGTGTILGDAANAQFGERVRRKLLQLEEFRLDIYNDNFDGGPRSKGPRSDVSKQLSLSFSKVADQFLERIVKDARISGSSEKWVNKVTANTALLEEIVGPETLIPLVDHELCLHVRDTLSDLPKNRLKKYPNLSVPEAIIRCKTDGYPTISETTQKTYLATLAKILDFAAKRQYLNSNPGSGMQPLRRKGYSNSNARKPFSVKQISQFFTGNYYSTCAETSPLRPFEAAQEKWRFWLPLVCLLMGMRPGEVCQLEPEDVRSTPTGTAYIDVNKVSKSGETHKKLKTVSSERQVPIHPVLLKMGFQDFVEEKLSNGSPLLFDDLQPNEYGDYGVKPLRRFNEKFLREEIDVLPRQSFYSLRRSFRDALRRCDAPDYALQALAGWSQRTVTSDEYGDKYDPDTNLKWMERVEFGDLGLSFLYCKDADHAADLVRSP